jgi:hypothetical protein
MLPFVVFMFVVLLAGAMLILFDVHSQTAMVLTIVVPLFGVITFVSIASWREKKPREFPPFVNHPKYKLAASMFAYIIALPVIVCGYIVMHYVFHYLNTPSKVWIFPDLLDKLQIFLVVFLGMLAMDFYRYFKAKRQHNEQ